MVYTCIVFETKRDIGRKTPIFMFPFIPLSFDLHDHPEPLRIYFRDLTQTVRVAKLLDDAIYCRKVQPSSQGARTSQTDDRRQTELR